MMEFAAVIAPRTFVQGSSSRWTGPLDPVDGGDILGGVDDLHVESDWQMKRQVANGRNLPYV